MQSWSIIIFCYNEKGNVSNVIKNCITVLQKLSTSRELIIVDDGSTDGSIDEIKDEISKTPTEKIKLIQHPVNQGIGMALKTGYAIASNENVCAVPADGQFDINELLPFTTIQNNSFISFYRKENQSYSLARNILSLFNKLFNKLLLGINFKDINWVKIYKTEIIKELDLQLNSSLIETEICAKLVAKKHTFIEVESKYLNRKNGVSKGASWKIVSKVLAELVKVYLSVLAFKRKKQVK
ncbi:MAG: glycosyltransferase family 2 protein [Bacteroidia bacterium]